MERTKELNIQELLYAILNKIWLVIILTLALAVAMYFYTAKLVTPMYRASVTMYVNNSTKLFESENQIEHIASSDLATSERLVTTYVTILESDTVLQRVSDEVYETTGVRISTREIRAAMSAAAVNKTEVFRVNISHADPQMAATVANAIANAAPEALAAIVEGSSTKVIDHANVPSAPYSPNTMQNTAVGGFAGALIAVVFIAIKVLMDVRIHGEEDLANLSQAPILGVIPDFEVEEEKGYSYTSKKSSDISEVKES